jgi:hypothetical protein
VSSLQAADMRSSMGACGNIPSRDSEALLSGPMRLRSPFAPA